MVFCLFACFIYIVFVWANYWMLQIMDIHQINPEKKVI